MMNFAVIFAGGVGSRMHSKRSIPKQFLKVHGKPIIAHTIDIFQKSKDIDAIVVSIVSSGVQEMRTIVEKYGFTKVICIVEGGTTGQLSIFNGLQIAKKHSRSNDDIVLIHDGVRPLINQSVISENIESVRKFGSAITTAPAKETFVLVNDDKNVVDVVDRKKSFIAKAPQSFNLDEIFQIEVQAIKTGRTDIIDSSTLMGMYGKTLHIVEGPYENIKITTPDDFYMFKALFDAKENEQIYGL